ncbi:MAG TPA: hypothetical protein PK736_06450 [Bacteroidia bacterium]|nr:hypothetical protein [Bacteroidia bacterium]
MELITLKQKLHNYLEVANEKKIKAIYTMLETDIEESLVEYTLDLKADLDKRKKEYKAGNLKMITATESKARIDKLRNQKSKM